MPIEPADLLYEDIRRDTEDVGLIAQHTGWKPTSIAKVKAHLFLELHHLDAYEHLGVPGSWARFDSDLIIAESWLRLKAGTFSSLDLQLLRHEAAEAWYMRKTWSKLPSRSCGCSQALSGPASALELSDAIHEGW